LNSLRKTTKTARRQEMQKYQCMACGWIYDPAENNNIPFEELPDDFVCPECGVGKDIFEPYE